MNMFDFFGESFGTNLFGAPTMFNDMPVPGMPMTGAPTGTPQADMPAIGAQPAGLAGADKDFFVPPGPQVPPPPLAGSSAPMPTAQSQMPPPRADQAPPGAPPPAPIPHPPNFGPLPTVAEGGVGPDIPPGTVTADPATTGATPAAAPGDPKKPFDWKGALNRFGDLKASMPQGGGAPKPASIGSAGQPHIPQGAAQLFSSILEGRQKALPPIGKVPNIREIMAGLR